MFLGLHLRCVYPGSHRDRGVTFRRAELGTAAGGGFGASLSLRGFGHAATDNRYSNGKLVTGFHILVSFCHLPGSTNTSGSVGSSLLLTTMRGSAKRRT